jgi:hypothetical protein
MNRAAPSPAVARIIGVGLVCNGTARHLQAARSTARTSRSAQPPRRLALKTPLPAIRWKSGNLGSCARSSTSTWTPSSRRSSNAMTHRLLASLSWLEVLPDEAWSLEPMRAGDGCAVALQSAGGRGGAPVLQGHGPKPSTLEGEVAMYPPMFTQGRGGSSWLQRHRRPLTCSLYPQCARPAKPLSQALRDGSLPG